MGVNPFYIFLFLRHSLNVKPPFCFVDFSPISPPAKRKQFVAPLLAYQVSVTLILRMTHACTVCALSVTGTVVPVRWRDGYGFVQLVYKFSNLNLLKRFFLFSNNNHCFSQHSTSFTSKVQ